MKHKVYKGFTLIELLVVIAVIGMLASIVLVSLNGARAKARDAKRLANKKQIITAINLYYDANNAWPPDNGGWTCIAPGGETCWNGTYSGSNALIAALQPYLSYVPTNDANPSSYAYNRVLFNSNTTLVPAPGITGVYLIWAVEKTLSNADCPLIQIPSFDSYYSYCWEYIGKQ